MREPEPSFADAFRDAIAATLANIDTVERAVRDAIGYRPDLAESLHRAKHRAVAERVGFAPDCKLLGCPEPDSATD